MKRGKEPLVPLGQVSAKAKLRRGRKNLGMSYVNDAWIRCGKKFSNEGKYDNLVVGNFRSQMCVLREEKTRVLTLCIAYDIS